jgi:hypothetical protein
MVKLWSNSRGYTRTIRSRDGGTTQDVVGSQWAFGNQWMKAMPGPRLRRAVVHAAVCQVLHGHDRSDLLCGLELINVGFGEADVADLALGLHVDQHPHPIVDGEVGIHPVQLQ